MRRRTPDVPPEISPEAAGANLARLSRRHDLLLYECFAPDLIGHRRDMGQALDWLATFDRFLEATVQGMSPSTTLVLTSDHGNMERLDVVSHTRNPVPLLVIGPDTRAFARVGAITGVTPAILELLGTAHDPDVQQRSDPAGPRQ
jgi:phosphopentomutase